MKEENISDDRAHVLLKQLAERVIEYFTVGSEDDAHVDINPDMDGDIDLHNMAARALGLPELKPGPKRGSLEWANQYADDREPAAEIWDCANVLREEALTVDEVHEIGDQLEALAIRMNHAEGEGEE